MMHGKTQAVPPKRGLCFAAQIHRKDTLGIGPTNDAPNKIYRACTMGGTKPHLERGVPLACLNFLDTPLDGSPIPIPDGWVNPFQDLGGAKTQVT